MAEDNLDPLYQEQEVRRANLRMWAMQFVVSGPMGVDITTRDLLETSAAISEFLITGTLPPPAFWSRILNEEKT